MGCDRRTFLHQTASSLLAFGITQSGIIRSTQTLAAATPRKLALLVGIDRYGDGSCNLQGCVTDVGRQQELLIYRFGFAPGDIITLTDQQATREQIETAFSEHLIAQAQPGDVVVFHFSGYGNQIKFTSLGGNEQEINTFLPSDGLLNKKPIANEIQEETLFLLGRSLATEQVTMVLDTSHSTRGRRLQGNLRVRSFPVSASEINAQESGLQAELQDRLKTLKQRSPLPGTLLSASGNDRLATEIIGNGWSAGLFTYALTQHLWQVTPACRVYVTLNQVREQVEHLSGLSQQPQLLKNGKSRPIYDLMPLQSIGAEGVVTGLAGEKTAEIRLTGLKANLIDDYGIASCFVVTPSSRLTGRFPSPEDEVLQIASRQGLLAKTQRLTPTETLEVGQSVQEWIRVLPRELDLVIALDSSLSRIERVDATSALATIPLPNSIVITPGEQRVDCLLSKIAAVSVRTSGEEGSVIPATAADASFAMGSYHLATSGGILIPSTVGLASEAVKSAVQRLVPPFKTLLAAKLWQLTCNEGSSRLLVDAQLEQLTTSASNSLRRETRLTAEFKCTAKAKPGMADRSSIPLEGLDPIPKIPIGTEIQYHLENYGQDPIYCLLMGIDASGRGFTLSLSRPAVETALDRPGQLQDNIIPPGQTLILPSAGLATWRVASPIGLTEIYLICSRRSFAKTLKALETGQVFNHERNPISTLSQPLEVARAILDDLHQASAVSSDLLSNSPDSYALDVNAWATLTFIYQVVG